MVQDNNTLVLRQEKYNKWATIINETDTKEFTVKYKDGREEKMRLFVSANNEICYYGKGMRRYGYRMYLESIEDIVPKQLKANSEYNMFHRNTTKAAEMLLASGLWPNMQKQMEAMSKMTLEEYEKTRQLCDAYFDYSNGLSYDKKKKREDIILADFNAMFQQYGCPLGDIYHFNQLKYKGQIISVPFYDGGYGGAEYYKAESRRIFDEVKNSERGETTQGIRWQGRYDYSIEFKKDNDGNLFGWYSAEYKGYGNGHYYLMLNATHAIYYEDD